MQSEIIPSDVAILDLLRKQRTMSVTQLASVLGVTATAVRQRLTRLMGQGYIDRVVDRAGRGRPTHRYGLTSKGRRKTGANFGDLAIALWAEIRAISDPEVRTGLIQRLSRRLAESYADQIEGSTVEMRMQAVVDLFQERQVPFEVEPARDGTQLPVLTALACPYPELAEQDRSICSMERMLFAELLGQNVKLSKCRLDGEDCCKFEVRVEEQSAGGHRSGSSS